MRRAAPGIATLPPVHISHDAAHNARTTAIVVCHGMGQQVRFQTIGDLVNALRRSGKISGAVGGRLVRFATNVTLGRAELKLKGPHGDRAVHIYEAYWAPLTEGRVTLRDVLSFLWRAGVDGIRHAVHGEFTRFMFNAVQTFPAARWSFWRFVAALAVLGSVALMDAAATAIIAARTGIRPLQWLRTAGFQRAIAGDILIFGVGIAVFLAGLALHTPMRRAAQKAAEMYPRGRFVSAAPMYLWFASAVVAGVMIAVHIVEAVMGVPLTRTLMSWPALPERVEARVLNGLWISMLAISYVVRRLLVSYVGDVAAYVSGHRLSRFDEIRDQIKKAVFDATYSIYKEGGYGRCIMVGHSLGSVSAYDALNAVINEQKIAHGAFAPTAGFVTFGSPLDKTAFIFRTHRGEPDNAREALAAAVQPLITDEAVRPPWINIWSPNDIISGELDLYDQPDKSNRHAVENAIDWDADRPLFAHVQYWKNPLLAKTLHKLCMAPWHESSFTVRRGADRTAETGT